MRRSPASTLLRLLLAALPALGGLGAVHGPAAQREARAAEDLKAVRDAVLKALDDKDPAKRARAFQPLESLGDPKALEIAVEGARKVGDLVGKVRAQQVAAEKQFEKAVNDAQELDRLFAAKNDGSPKAAEAYNKRSKKISKERDAALEALRTLENEYVRVRGLADAAVGAAGAVLRNVDGGALEGALDLLDRAWLRDPQPDVAVRFIDAVGGHSAENARRRIRLAAADAALPSAVRAAAVTHLAGVRDAGLAAAISPYLGLGADQFVLVAATIRALRVLHVEEAIGPLIGFLEREDVGRLRTDAHEALLSLTGQTHGPYGQPWRAWWKDAKDAFRMPPEPSDGPSERPAGKGVTFYGITTFSERILFVLDVSGSMDKPNAADKPQPDRMTAAKKELLGAIFNVGDGHRFNVLMFNHEVLPWQPGMVVASEDQRRKAKAWVEERQPVGGTNIHDALEAAFGLALKTTGEPVLDTIFFLTDGTPTAGKVQDPKAILAEVEDWNRAAKLTVHCIALGEADHDFLRDLAKLTGGTFLKR